MAAGLAGARQAAVLRVALREAALRVAHQAAAEQPVVPPAGGSWVAAPQGRTRERRA